MTRFLGVTALFLALVAGAGQCLAGDRTLSIRDAWVRAPVLDGRPAAGYFTIVNLGGHSQQIVGARSSAARRVELHRHIMKDGRMMMRQVDAVDVGAGATLVFEPHGHHLMIFGLGPVGPGDSVPITLEFADHPPITVMAEVVEAGAGAPRHLP